MVGTAEGVEPGIEPASATHKRFRGEINCIKMCSPPPRRGVWLFCVHFAPPPKSAIFAQKY